MRKILSNTKAIKKDLLNKGVSSAENEAISERSGSTNSEGVVNVLQNNGKFNTDLAEYEWYPSTTNATPVMKSLRPTSKTFTENQHSVNERQKVGNVIEWVPYLQLMIDRKIKAMTKSSLTQQPQQENEIEKLLDNQELDISQTTNQLSPSEIELMMSAAQKTIQMGEVRFGKK